MAQRRPTLESVECYNPRATSCIETSCDNSMFAPMGKAIHNEVYTFVIQCEQRIAVEKCGGVAILWDLKRSIMIVVLY